MLDEDTDGHGDDEGDEADGDHVIGDGNTLVRVVPAKNVDLTRITRQRFIIWTYINM